jgi:asparaginyl-tRNA synthetase
MLETEIAFLDSLDDLVNFAQDYFVGICKSAYGMPQQAMEQLWNDNGEFGSGQRQWHFTDFQDWMKKGCPISRITYDQAKIVCGGDGDDKSSDLTREQEIQIVQHFNGPVFVTDWPTSVKPFYMLRDGTRRDRVKCFDLLIPNVGEIIGGSLREHDYSILEQNIREAGMKPDSLAWYLDLRRFGSAPHGGFGIGSDRLVQFLSGSASIQDVTFLPRSYKTCPF